MTHNEEKKLSEFLYENQATENINEKIRLLERIKKRYKKCSECPLSTQGATQVVFGSGAPNAQLMFIGEGPGKDEDMQGEPFVGRAGKLLNKIITAMELKREDVYISNAVKCRPPGNRTPLPLETKTCCNHILFREIQIVQPQIICTLGSPATKALLGEDVQIGKARGLLAYFKDIPVIPTYHPAYLLRNPSAKKATWEDIKKIMAFLKKQGTLKKKINIPENLLQHKLST